MTDVVVVVEGLGKRYRIDHPGAPYGRLTESLSSALRTPLRGLRRTARREHEWIWAVKDVSFDLRRGDVLGVVGRNGAGKTTLLRLLSRITEPTTGQAKMRGRVGSLLEVGTGFHPELTGRENIYMSGAILGMRRIEIDRNFDEIVDFAGTEQFLDTPVKRYSSGMLVRLGFAVAAHLETEVLIVDEVLAVGDAAFQRKCLAKMGDVSRLGRTVLFVSHNMPAVEALCTSAMLLDHGVVQASGAVRDVVDAYLRSAHATGSTPVGDRQDRKGNGRIRVTGVEASFRTGAPGQLRILFESDGSAKEVALSVGLFTIRGEGALYLSTALSGHDLGTLPERGAIVCSLERTSLLPGRYSVNVHCTTRGTLADWVVDAATIDVAEGDWFRTGRLPPQGYGSVLVDHRWTLEA